MSLTWQTVSDAWEGVTDRWITRRHWKYDDGRQWEVVHDWGVDVIDEATMALVERFHRIEEADDLAEELEAEARATAALKAVYDHLMDAAKSYAESAKIRAFLRQEMKPRDAD